MKVKTQNMYSKYCPFIRKNCIMEECVHFQFDGVETKQWIIPEDAVKEFNLENNKATIRFKVSSCRLWRD